MTQEQKDKVLAGLNKRYCDRLEDEAREQENEQLNELLAEE
jgi:hypothetical protein